MTAQTLFSLIAGAAIGGAAGYLGSLMLGRRMSLVAGPLGHLTLPGVALALVYGFDVSLGAFPFVAVGVAVIWLLERRTRLPMEALTALVFSSGVAAAFLFLPIAQAEAALVGDIARVGAGEAAFAAVMCVAVILVVRQMYARLVLINISEELATSEGVSVGRANFIYLVLISIIVALGVKMVGSLLTAALVSIPPATARRVGNNLRTYAVGSAIVGATSAVLGLVLADLTGAPAGPLIVVVGAATFVLTLLSSR